MSLGSKLVVPAKRGFFAGGYPDFLTCKIIPIRTTSLANGQNDLYTVPANRRAAISYTLTNQTGGALNHTFQIKISGTYYSFIVQASLANNTSTLISNAISNAPIAEAGETLSILTSGVGLVLSGFIVEFSVSEFIKSPKILTLVNGNNTIYTCPPNKKAFIGSSLASNAGLVKYGNFTGANRAIHWNVVRQGNTPATSNQISANITGVVSGTINSITQQYAGLTAGDFISINSDSALATQLAFIPCLVELPA